MKITRSNKRRRSGRLRAQIGEETSLTTDAIVVVSRSPDSTPKESSNDGAHCNDLSHSKKKEEEMQSTRMPTSNLSSYYDGISLEGAFAPQTEDPFRELSDRLVELEGLVEKYRKTNDPVGFHDERDKLQTSLRNILECVGPCSDHRLEYQTAMLALNGVRILLRIVKDVRFSPTTETISSLVLQILCHLCWKAPTETPAAPSIALQIAKTQDGIETFLRIITTGMSSEALGIQDTSVHYAWNLLCNLTYFGSVLEELGTNRLWEMVEVALWAIRTLDACLYRKLSSTKDSPKRSTRRTKKDLPTDGKANPNHDMTANRGQLTWKEPQEGRLVEPILGTLLNLIADDKTSQEEWGDLLSNLLDIFCEEGRNYGSFAVTTTKGKCQSTNEKELVHEPFVEFLEQIPVRCWTIQIHEEAMWNLLKVFRVCATKGILSFSSLYDIERLCRWLAHCLRVYSSSSTRIVQGIVDLLHALLITKGEGWFSSSDFARKILVSEGSLEKLQNAVNHRPIENHRQLESVMEALSPKIG